MTRQDSAQTPYFIPTPQRTDSNWGDSTYLNNPSKDIAKSSMQLYDAIQNV